MFEPIKRKIEHLQKLLRAASTHKPKEPASKWHPLDLERPWNMPFPVVADEQDILYCFRLILGRWPGKPEWPGHRGLAGGDLTTVVKTYLSSKEFEERQLLRPQTPEPVLVELEGYSMYVPPEDMEVGRHIYGSRMYEPHVSAAIKQHVMPGMTFVDIGANIGYFTFMASSLVGERGSVLAFEPNAENVKFILGSMYANHSQNIKVYPVAVCEAETLLAYSNMGTNGVIGSLSDSSDAFRATNLVYGISLDAFLKDLSRLDVLKIDVEGAEYRALKGARNLLRQHRPLIFSEFSTYALEAVSKVSGERYLQFLVEEHGYQISVIDVSDGLISYGSDIAGVMQYFDAACTDHIDIAAFPSM